MSDETELSQNELETLKARADRLGIKYHPSIGLDKLREKVAEALAEPSTDAKDKEPSAPVVGGEAPAETLGQKRKRLKDEATRLVRIRLTCMNPAKREWDGEIITVGNSLVGSLTKFVPFNAEDGWHVPHMMYLFLKERQCPIFFTEKSHRGVAVRKSKLIKEFAIEVLPDLTAEELHDLAQRQAMAKSID